MKTIWQTFLWSVGAGIAVFLLAILGHAFFDKDNARKEAQESTQTVVIADDSPVGTYNWAAVVASIAALAVSALTLVSQNKVAENTSMLSYKAQEQALYDLVRHLYRNMVVMWAILNRIDDAAQRSVRRAEGTPPAKSADKYGKYPSELHLIKAQAPIDNIHPELFVNDDCNYSDVNNMLLQLRNYNTELGIAANQLKEQNLTKDDKDYYIDTLLLKPAQLTNLVIKVLAALKGFNLQAQWDMEILNLLDKRCPKLWKRYMRRCNKEYNISLEDIHATAPKERNKKYIAEMRKILIDRNLPEVIKQCEKIITDSHSGNVGRNKGCTPWDGAQGFTSYENAKTYTSNIFHARPDNFLAMLNKDALIECGKNSSGGDKLLIIGL